MSCELLFGIYIGEPTLDVANERRLPCWDEVNAFSSTQLHDREVEPIVMQRGPRTAGTDPYGSVFDRERSREQIGKPL